MYNIKQAAARAGVTVPVLRAWERRYRIVQPARTASGYRVFDDATVARIRTMRTLVEGGWSPSSAAAAILAGTAPEVTAPEDREGASSPLLPGGSVARPDDAHAEAAALAARLVDGARSLDPDAVSAVLDDLFAHGSFERVATDLLFPAMERLGEAWAAGEVGVAGEHMASSAVLRRLGQALEAAGGSGGHGQPIIVGMPPGGRHEIGAMAFAVAARRAGLAVTYLGPDLPVDDWAAAARGATAAVIGVVVARDRNPALEVARRVHAEQPGLLVAFGGHAAPATDSALVLPRGLSDSVAAIVQAINRAPRAAGEAPV